MPAKGADVTVFGWDASDFDWARGPMDLAAVKRDGIAFFTHKATEGTRIQHAHYGEALNRARAAGMPFMGAYLVVRTPGNNGHGPVADQVAYFLAYLDAQTPWWRTFPGFFFQVDLEHWGYDDVPAWVGVEACRLLDFTGTGKWTVLYAPRWAYGDTIPGTAGLPLWASAYGTNPAVPYRDAYPGDGSSGWAPYSGRTPAILQYGSRLTIGGQPTCDANAYRGTLDQFRKLITGDDMPLTDDDATKVALAVWRAGLGGIIGPNELRKTAETWLIEGHDHAAAASAKQAVAPVALSDADRAGIVADLAALLPKPPTAAEVAEELAKRLGNG